ncbi:MAG: hypothetical protein AB1942_03710 [Pseudomonadota bacterium]
MQRRKPILAPLIYALLAGGADAAAADLRRAAEAPSCEKIAAERAALETEVARRSGTSDGRAGFLRFARGAASYAAPHLLGQLGGGSGMGSVAARAAGQGAVAALSQPTPEASSATPTPKPSRKQQARLDRLSRLAADQKCPA